MNKSLKLKIIVIFAGIIMLSGFLVSYISITTSTRLVADSVGSQALEVTNQALTKIDMKKYQEISVESGESDYYLELRETLNEIRETNGLVYLYTMKREKTDKGYDYFYMVDGMPKGSDDASQLGEKEEEVDEYPDLIATFETGKSQIGEMSYTEGYGALVSAYIPLTLESGEVIGLIGADFDATSIYEIVEKNKFTMTVITAIILLISIIFLYFFTNSLVTPLQRLTKHAELVGNGDLTVQIETKRQDEIGNLSNAFNQMLQNLREIIHEINNNSHELNKTSLELLNRTSETRVTSNQMASTMELISQNSTSQYKNLEENVAVIEEISMGVSHIAQSSNTAFELSSNTVEQVENGNEKLKKLIQQMSVIRESVNNSSTSITTLKSHSKEISTILTIIQDISSQTNLLALNAAIEAARAGEAGKGFAVVAAEVRKLAEQSEQSTKNIQELIEKIENDTTHSVSSMEEVMANVNEGMKDVNETGKIFGTILAATEGVNQQIQEVSSTSEQMSASAEEISASSLETAKIAEQAASYAQGSVSITSEQEKLIIEMSDSIERLSTMSTHLKEVTSKFNL